MRMRTRISAASTRLGALAAAMLIAAACSYLSPASTPPAAASFVEGADPVLAALLPKTIQGKTTVGFTGSIDNVGKGDITVICAVFCPESGPFADELRANPHAESYGFAWIDGIDYAIAAIRIPNAPTDRLVQAWANARFRAGLSGTSPAATPPPGTTPTPEPTAPNTPPGTVQIGGKQLFVVGDGPPRFDLVYPYKDVLFVIAVKSRDGASVNGPAEASRDAGIQALVAALP